MIQTCKCGEEFLTEADPYVFNPVTEETNCGCYFRNKSCNDIRIEGIRPAISAMGGWANFKRWVLKGCQEDIEEIEKLKAEVTRLNTLLGGKIIDEGVKK